jgi:hypothetical protein
LLEIQTDFEADILVIIIYFIDIANHIYTISDAMNHFGQRDQGFFYPF